MKRLNKNMHGDDPAYYRLPDSRELAAQYLLLYEMSLPYGLDLNNQINVDKSATRFTVTLSDIGSDEIRDLSKRGEQWLKQYAPEEMHAIGSGPMVMFAHISGINIQSMLTGSIFALALISLLMIFALRSTRLGLISFVPNMIPAAVAFGVWGLTSGIVNLGLSIVIGMTMGIVVDDSIHFLSKYRRARREKNMSETEAVRYTFSNVGRALTVTSVILVIGFGILATSAFDMNASMGKMTAVTIALALIADFFFLPPLLMLLDRKKPAKLVFISKPKQAELPEPAFNTINKQ
jgi:predicted RND superfamily exporter protein